MIASFLLVFCILLFFHFLADYPLQGPFIAQAKNHNTPVPHVPWYHILFAHAFIHAGFVFLVTGSAIAFVGELIAHFVIDNRKCAGELTFQQDQYAHFACKALWAGLLVVGVI
jgi:hypothetical protein